MIIRRERRDRFTVIDNVAVDDVKLSFKALGLLTYLLSKPDGWSANYRQLATARTDGEASVRSGMTELREAGYLEQTKITKPDGTFEWDCVIRERPCGGNPGMDDPGVEKPRISKKLESKEPPVVPQGGRRAKIPTRVTELLEGEQPIAFEEFWRVYPRKESKFDAMKAWLQMLDKLPPVDKLIAAVLTIEPRMSRDHPNSAEWRKFIPQPAKWLRSGGWIDAVELVQPVRAAAEKARMCAVCGISPVDPANCMIEAKELGTIDACPWRQP